MCLFTTTHHACPHSRHTLERACPYYPRCTPSPTTTISTHILGGYSCGRADCGYTVASDPFVDDTAMIEPLPGVGEDSFVQGVDYDSMDGNGDIEMGGMERRWERRRVAELGSDFFADFLDAAGRSGRKRAAGASINHRDGKRGRMLGGLPDHVPARGSPRIKKEGQAKVMKRLPEIVVSRRLAMAKLKAKKKWRLK